MIEVDLDILKRYKSSKLCQIQPQLSEELEE